MNTTTPYDRKRIERMIASELARRFAGSVSDEQCNVILRASDDLSKAQHALRLAVAEAVDEATHRR